MKCSPYYRGGCWRSRDSLLACHDSLNNTFLLWNVLAILYVLWNTYGILSLLFLWLQKSQRHMLFYQQSYLNKIIFKKASKISTATFSEESIYFLNHHMLKIKLCLRFMLVTTLAKPWSVLTFLSTENQCLFSSRFHVISKLKFKKIWEG